MKKWNRAWKLKLIIEKNPQWRDLYNDVLVGAGYSPITDNPDHSGFPPNTTHANYVCAGPGRGNDDIRELLVIDIKIIKLKSKPSFPRRRESTVIDRK